MPFASQLENEPLQNQNHADGPDTFLNAENELSLVEDDNSFLISFVPKSSVAPEASIGDDVVLSEFEMSGDVNSATKHSKPLQVKITPDDAENINPFPVFEKRGPLESVAASPYTPMFEKGRAIFTFEKQHIDQI